MQSNVFQERELARKLTNAMLVKLEANREKEHWVNTDGSDLIEEASIKLRKFKKAYEKSDSVAMQGLAADIANFLQMAVENETEEA